MLYTNISWCRVTHRIVSLSECAYTFHKSVCIHIHKNHHVSMLYTYISWCRVTHLTVSLSECTYTFHKIVCIHIQKNHHVSLLYTCISWCRVTHGTVPLSQCIYTFTDIVCIHIHKNHHISVSYKYISWCRGAHRTVPLSECISHSLTMYAYISIKTIMHVHCTHTFHNAENTSALPLSECSCTFLDRVCIRIDKYDHVCILHTIHIAMPGYPPHCTAYLHIYWFCIDTCS